jgi:hypothetical protein
VGIWQGNKNKKPLNPVMGELFLARTPAATGDVVYYYTEQVSHHPPGSAAHYEAPSKQLSMYGTLFPRAGFSGLGTEGTRLRHGTRCPHAFVRPPPSPLPHDTHASNAHDGRRFGDDPCRCP